MPHNITMIPLEPPFRALQYKNVNTKLFKIIGNPLSSIEQPYLLILHTLYIFDTRYPILCFVQETDLTTKIPHIKKMGIVNIVEDEDMKDTKRERLENCSQEVSLNNNRKNCHKNTDKLAPITENSAFMFHKDFYPKPRIALSDAELSLETKQQLKTLSPEFSDIMSKSSSDIGLTHVEEMVLHTEPGIIPVVSKPYSLPLKHHKLV